MKTKITCICITLFSIISVAQSKVGTIDSEYIISLMPETSIVLKRSQAYGAKLDSSFSVKVKEYQTKVETFKKNEKTLGFISDVGHVTQLLLESIKDVHTLFIESNYDEILLQNDTRRPWALKQRIASRHGHLSNKQTAELIGSIAEGGLLKSVILGHLSNDCNSPEVARAEVILALSNLGINDVEVSCASRSETSGPFVIESEINEEQGNNLDGYTQEEFTLFS